jgi:hypothetical protein
MCSGPMMRLNSYQIAAADKYACYRDLVPPTTTMASIVQTLGAKKSGVNTWTQRFLPKVPVWLPANFVGVLLLQPYDLRRTNSAIEYSGPRIWFEKSAWDCRQYLLLQGLGTRKEFVCEENLASWTRCSTSRSTSQLLKMLARLYYVSIAHGAMW